MEGHRVYALGVLLLNAGVLCDAYGVYVEALLVVDGEQLIGR